jgi:hypothetical protein
MIFLRFGSLLTMSNKIIYDTNYDVKFIVLFRRPLGAGGRDCAITDSFFRNIWCTAPMSRWPGDCGFEAQKCRMNDNKWQPVETWPGQLALPAPAESLEGEELNSQVKV